MTITKLLSIPNKDLAKLSDSELLALLGPLIPECRKPDKDSLVLSDAQRLQNQAQLIASTGDESLILAGVKLLKMN